MVDGPDGGLLLGIRLGGLLGTLLGTLLGAELQVSQMPTQTNLTGEIGMSSSELFV